MRIKCGRCSAAMTGTAIECPECGWERPSDLQRERLEVKQQKLRCAWQSRMGACPLDVGISFSTVGKPAKWYCAGHWFALNSEDWGGGERLLEESLGAPQKFRRPPDWCLVAIKEWETRNQKK